ncbi:UNVERIFIED_CONTAM: hypothetical protein GTU68_064695 [Idotea baltica]|nr:hypothetical protein [Idotea baltica]
MDAVHITSEQISVETIYNSVLSSSCGAVSLFAGTTRDNFQGKQVTQLEYEAYESMAKCEMRNICQEVRNQWPTVENVHIAHRIG